MKTKRRHNRRRERRRTRKRQQRGGGKMTHAESALVVTPPFREIANAVMIEWENKGFYPVTQLTTPQLKKLQLQTARRVLKAMGGPAGARHIEKILLDINRLQTGTIQSLIKDLNRRSVATSTASAAKLPPAGGGGGGGGGEAVYDTDPQVVAALFSASDMAVAMPVAPTAAPVAAPPTRQRVAIAIPRNTTGGGRRRSRHRRRRLRRRR